MCPIFHLSRYRQHFAANNEKKAVDRHREKNNARKPIIAQA
jgi:hypothetical protein